MDTVVIECRRPGGVWEVINHLRSLNTECLAQRNVERLRREATRILHSYERGSSDNLGYFKNWDFRLSEQ